MIAAPPPAYHQEISIDDARLRPQGAGADSQLVDVTLRSAILHLKTSFEHLVRENDEYEYTPPPPQAVTTKRVRFRYLGPGKPMPRDDEEFECP